MLNSTRSNNAGPPLVSAPELSLPQAGKTNGYGETVQPTLFTGTATLTIPIHLSPGRVDPNPLVLSYSSGAGNGQFGLGVAISIPYIALRTERGIPRYADTDTYILSDGQQLIPRYDQEGDDWKPAVHQRTVDGVDYQVVIYRPRVELAFSNIEQWTNTQTLQVFWRITDRENEVSIYGKDANARISDPNNPSHIFQWLLESTTDAHGNRTLYSYKQENDENIPPRVFTEGHINTANKYPERILYGNYTRDDGSEAYAFEVIFDYGEYQLDPPVLHPVRPWSCREDIFSSFRSGFEIRTYRLCQNILMIHHLPEALGADGYLVNVTHLEYLGSGLFSFLSSVQRVGYRRNANGSYWTQPLPRLELGYTQWEPEQQTFQTLQVYGGGELPGVFGASTLQMVDLYGEGLPGLLNSTSGSLLYWQPRGEGTYDPPVAVPLSPSEADFGDRRYALLDINGTGALDLVVGEDSRGGFYPNHRGLWESYREFPSYTAEFSAAGTEFVDINGDGLTDLYIPNGRYLRYYLSRREKGFGPPVEQLISSPFPSTSDQTETLLITFADMFGDGLAHRVVIGSGDVRIWPSLGYGNFGAEIIVGNAPQFGPSLQTSRVLLADVNGSGRASMLFVYDDHVDVFVNQNGNYFGDAIRIDLPFAFSDADQVITADILGTGLASLVFTSTSAQGNHPYFDFCGSKRPYLLESLNNNVGGRTRTTYRSSTAYYLADRNSEEPWVTRLAFPVDVVAQIETFDDLSGSRIVKAYQYADGYYDPVAREFRGFGYVQTQDTETFSPAVWHFPTAIEPPATAAHPVAPALTKTWIHTGAYILNDVISKQFEEEYYHGDPDALTLPDTVFSPDIYRYGGDTLREAYSALQGQQIHAEVCGVSADGTVDVNPYTVAEANYTVKLLQPRIGDHSAVFYVSTRESVTSNYERAPDDPRIHHQFNLVLDDFGNVERAAAVYYRPRAAEILPGQELSVTVAEAAYINHEDDFYVLGLPYAAQEYELGGLTLAPGVYFTFEQISALAEEAIIHVIEYGQRFTPGQVQARPYQMWRSYFWNSAQTAPLPLGETSAQALLHHSATAVFPPSLITGVFGTKVTETMLRDELKYAYEESYWWNPGLVEFYLGAAGYYLSSSVVDPFGDTTRVEYDRYYMDVISMRDSLGQTVIAETDYQAMQTRLILDVNKNTSEVLFDPLGDVFVSSLYRMKDDQIVAGNMPLSDYAVIPYATTREVLDDPARFLQGASVYYFYNLTSWAEPAHQPVHSILLERHVYVYGPDGVGGSLIADENQISVTINYADGLSRPLCKKVKIEAAATPVGGDGFVWINKEQVVYDEKSQPIKQYLPYYTAGFEYDFIPPSPFFTIFYDALDRPIRTLTPKGFYTETIYTSWTQVYFDEDDTVVSSPYYQANINNHDPQFANELNALEKAAVFNDTPTTWDLNGPGLIVQETRINVFKQGEVIERQLLHSAFWLDIQENQIKIVDPRFYNDQDPYHPRQFNFINVFDMTSQTLSAWSADAGTRLSLSDVRENPVYGWDTLGYETTRAYDALSRLLSIHVAGNGLDQFTDLIRYGADPDLNNVNRMVQHNDTAGIADYLQYDIQGNLTLMSRRLLENYDGTVNWNDPPLVPLMPETWTISRIYDASNILTREVSADGSVYLPAAFLNGWTRSVSMKFAGSLDERIVVGALTYSPMGNRRTVSYADPGSAAPTFTTASVQTYDATDGRLQSIQTTRLSDQYKLQDLHYTYDPMGNVTGIEDFATVSQAVEPPGGYLYDYTYNAIYELKVATGRQQTGLAAETCRCSLPAGSGPNPTNPSAAGPAVVTFGEQYNYDLSGNLTLLEHTVPAPEQSWSTEVVVSDTSNHAMPKDALNGNPVDAFFDASGNQNGLITPATLHWDYINRLIRVPIVRGPGLTDESFSLYDGGGRRMREVVKRLTNNVVSQITDTLYIGNLLVARTTVTPGGGEPQGAWRMNSLRVMLNDRCALITSTEAGSANSGRSYRYQLDNSLNSVAVEVDQFGQLTTYEEYFPYGCTAVLSGASDAAIEEKRFRYNGKELDRSTGLYYYGARYYAPWQFRWLSPDPAGISDGLNLYAYVRGNPITFNDAQGYCKNDPNALKKQQYYKQKLIQKAAFVFSETFIGASILASGLVLFPGASGRAARLTFRSARRFGINRQSVIYKAIFGTFVWTSRKITNPAFQSTLKILAPALEMAPVIGGLQAYITYKSLFPFPRDTLGYLAAAMGITGMGSGIIGLYEMKQIIAWSSGRGGHGRHGGHGSATLHRLSRFLLAGNVASTALFFTLAYSKYRSYGRQAQITQGPPSTSSHSPTREQIAPQTSDLRAEQRTQGRGGKTGGPPGKKQTNQA